MENHKDRRRIVQRRRSWILSLLSALCLLLGLILKVHAQAPVAVENPALHTFRPVLVEESFLLGPLHPQVKPAFRAHPPRVKNPTAQSDLEGDSCRKCHSSRPYPLAQAAGQSGWTLLVLKSHHGFGPDDACDACHLTQVSLE